MQIKARKFLSKKEKKLLLMKLSQTYGESASDLFKVTSDIEEVKTDKGIYLIKEGKASFFLSEEMYIPTIHYLREAESILPKVIVDIGAIRFITNGADVMAPGIVYFDNNIKPKTIVSIHEEKAESILGVGLSLLSSHDFKKTKKGKVVKLLHYLKDDIWNFRF
jgi:PUA domain protein